MKNKIAITLDQRTGRYKQVVMGMKSCLSRSQVIQEAVEENFNGSNAEG